MQDAKMQQFQGNLRNGYTEMQPIRAELRVRLAKMPEAGGKLAYSPGKMRAGQGKMGQAHAKMAQRQTGCHFRKNNKNNKEIHSQHILITYTLNQFIVMETTTNQPTEVITTSKRHYDTMDQSIAKMKLAFSNASLPEIFAVLAVVGYTDEKIAGLNADLAKLELLCQGQIKEYADKGDEQKKFSNKRAEVNKLFNQHRDLARILFKNNTHARISLQLDAENPAAYPAWVQLVTNFYSQLASNPGLQSKANIVSITESAVADQIQGLADVQGLKDSLRKETAEAESATELRDTAFDELFAQYVEYIRYAKVLLHDNQMLEAIGVKVSAN